MLVEKASREKERCKAVLLGNRPREEVVGDVADPCFSSRLHVEKAVDVCVFTRCCLKGERLFVDRIEDENARAVPCPGVDNSLHMTRIETKKFPTLNRKEPPGERRNMGARNSTPSIQKRCSRTIQAIKL